MSKRYKKQRRARRKKTCRGCGRYCPSVQEYWLPESDCAQPPDDILCSDCARLWYCLSCGAFCAGISSFDFLHPGRCDNCQSELEAESWPDDDDNFENGPWDDEP